MNEEIYMHRCLQLAACGLGETAPNPMVGCVVVHNNTIIGEGWHRKFGEAHAEVNAINAVKDQSLLPFSTLYVSLEPCAHHGKTPPCTELIIKHKIPEVVIGCRDTFHQVDGKGIEQLKQAGVMVKVGVLEKEALEINKRFFTFHKHKRPYIILKWAQTSDGFIGINPKMDWGLGIRNRGSSSAPNPQSSTPNPLAISNELSRTLVHKWRSEEQAIMVGTNTALADNPQLSVRLWKGKSPLRIVIDKELRLPLNLHLFDGKTPTLVFTEKEKESSENVEFIKINFGKESLTEIMKKLYERNIQSVIVEGGAKLLHSFIHSGMWDEARVFISEKAIGDGIKAPVINYETQVRRSQLQITKRKFDEVNYEIGNDKLSVFCNIECRGDS